MSDRTCQYDFHPSWFGGEDETELAIRELAEHTKETSGLIAHTIGVDRQSDPWIVTFVFLPKA